MDRPTDAAGGASTESELCGIHRLQTPTEYAHARPHIQDGDILLWRGRYLGSRIFRFLTDSPFSHAAIAARWDDRLLVLQAEWSGVQAVPLSRTVKHYNGLVAWYRVKEQYRKELDLKMLLYEARKDLGYRFDYAGVSRSTFSRVLRALGIVHRWGGYDLSQDSRRQRALYCSEYVERCFGRGGLPLSSRQENDTLPGDIAKSDKLVFQATLHNSAFPHGRATGPRR
jgi:hypothetical protein